MFASELKQPVGRQVAFSLEGAVSTVEGKPCERDMEARSLRLMDIGFVSQRTWELDCLISKLPSGSHIAGFLWFQASAGCGIRESPRGRWRRLGGSGWKGKRVGRVIPGWDPRAQARSWLHSTSI